MNAPAPMPNIEAHQGTISRISVETGEAGKRFVISLMIAANLALTNLKRFIGDLEKEILILAACIQNEGAMAKEIIADPKTKPETKARFEEMLLLKPDAIQQVLAKKETELAKAKQDSAWFTDTPTRYEYFSTPLGSEDSVRINTQQLRNAFPELMGLQPDTKVFETLLTQRSKFVGRPVHFTVSDQIDPTTGKPKMNDRTKRPYTNVRLEASSEDLSAEDALKLLADTSGGTLVYANTPAKDAPEKKPEAAVDDLPM